MTIRQLSVFMENKPGNLNDILLVLAQNNINIAALTVADTSDYGILRLLVSDPRKRWTNFVKNILLYVFTMCSRSKWILNPALFTAFYIILPRLPSVWNMCMPSVLEVNPSWYSEQTTERKLWK